MEAVSHNEFMYATSPDPPPPVRGSGTETIDQHSLTMEMEVRNRKHQTASPTANGTVPRVPHLHPRDTRTQSVHCIPTLYT